MKRIVGNKENFAIESEITTTKPYLMGKLCLWIGGIQVGTFDDEVMLLTIKASLTNLLEELDEIKKHEFVGMKDEDVFNLIYDDEFDNGPYLLHLGESFDDFSFFAFATEDEIHFFWQLHDKPYFSYPNYPEGIIHKKVKINEVAEVVQNDVLWNP